MGRVEDRIKSEALKFADSSENLTQAISEISASLLKEFAQSTALDRLLMNCMHFANSDGGTLYVLKDDKLNIFAMYNQTLDMMYDPQSNESRAIPVKNASGEPNSQFVAVHALIRKQSINIPNIMNSNHYEISGTKSFDKMHEYTTKSMLTVPLLKKDSVIGVLQLINSRSETDGKVVSFSPAIQTKVETLANAVTQYLKTADKNDESEKRKIAHRKRLIKRISFTILVLIVGAIIYYFGNYILLGIKMTEPYVLAILNFIF